MCTSVSCCKTMWSWNREPIRISAFTPRKTIITNSRQASLFISYQIFRKDNKFYDMVKRSDLIIVHYIENRDFNARNRSKIGQSLVYLCHFLWVGGKRVHVRQQKSTLMRQKEYCFRAKTVLSQCLTCTLSRRSIWAKQKRSELLAKSTSFYELEVIYFTMYFLPLAITIPL